MRNRLVILAGLGLLTGCSGEVPGFLGREGTGTSSYEMREEPLPDPVPLPMRQAELERALHGVILRVDGVAPTQGYHSAALRPAGGGDADTAGILGYELIAVPPAEVEAIGPERTRHLTAALFLPNRAIKNLSGLRVAGGGTVRTLALR